MITSWPYFKGPGNPKVTASSGTSKGGFMTRTGQHQRCISALVLGAMFVAMVIGTPAAQAQTYVSLHNFMGSDGKSPYTGLVRDSAGNLYGTTDLGGASGLGVVFNLDPTGTETVLYSFTGGSDGAQPYAGLIRDSTGNLYGTTVTGGKFGLGVVFKLDPTGTETVLHSFAGLPTDGANPYAGLIRDSAGNFYGTTYGGGTSGYGVVFKLDTTGTYTVLYTFTGGADGGPPTQVSPETRQAISTAQQYLAASCKDLMAAE
jgi:uncharacterized repeat protein (TIGR03803 family)